MPKFGESSDKLGKQKSIRFPLALDERLNELCRLTTRNPPDVIRAAVELLLDGGYEAADERLRRRLLEAPRRDSATTPKSAAEHAADLMPLESDRKREPRAGKRGA